MKMEQIAEKPEEKCDKAHSTSPLEQEVARAIEMMKRVKRAQTVHASVPPEDQRMPSLFVPPPLVLCVDFSR
jgi:hypothetical protein